MAEQQVVPAASHDTDQEDSEKEEEDKKTSLVDMTKK